MSDRRLRELERVWRESGTVNDEAAVLSERLRLGLLVPGRLSLAQTLDHPAARLLERSTAPLDSETCARQAMLHVHALNLRLGSDHDPEESAQHWLSTFASPDPAYWRRAWGARTGQTGAMPATGLWHELFDPNPDVSYRGYLGFVDETDRCVVWNGGRSARRRHKEIVTWLNGVAMVPWLLGYESALPTALPSHLDD